MTRMFYETKLIFGLNSLPANGSVEKVKKEAKNDYKYFYGVADLGGYVSYSEPSQTVSQTRVRARTTARRSAESSSQG